jgi:alanyl-tRNA synthetase
MMMTSAEIRQAFLDFFKSKDHLIVPSAPVVIKNDPTLLFTNAGMNQFKDYFLGNGAPPATRIADTQKCLRVSGKHNDLEEVGVDTYHHTLFEMLGNWSFGDYFKVEAIAWSWELLTSVYKIPIDRLYVSVFEGDEKENLPSSKIAKAEWMKIVAEDRIIMGNKKDNFWEMGDTGPCGPCSEIHVDMRSDAERALVPGRDLVNADHPQVIEIWNNVFMQYNRKKDGSLENLPATHVDTGMGFERLVRVIQGKSSNYDTDVFSGTIAATENITNKKYDGSDSKQAVSFRVIADHIRAISFTIADGQLPSNTGAGYVIRRILRRAVRYYFSYLDFKKPLLHELVPVLATQFELVFPELKAQQDFVKKVIFEEENNFLNTLYKGLRKMDDIIASKATAIKGEDAFELYDTFGFPLDLTQLIAQENNLIVDEAGFKVCMQKQKDMSKAATKINADDWIVLNDNDKSKFVGYNSFATVAKVLKHRKVEAKGKTQYQIVLSETPFYAESGGQVGDTGTLKFGDTIINVVDTKKENDMTIHFVETLPADLSGDVVTQINESRRRKITRHHSVTHLMQAALQQVLGSHIAQKGSMNNDENLRFDFSHFTKVTDEEMALVEKIVNQKIRQNIPVIIKEMPKEEAMKLGAMALFGEKYCDVVRVVIMDEKYSIELCGGTHVGYTGELNIFKITSESAVAAGVRRIEALAGCKAEAYINEQLLILNTIKTQLKNPKDLIGSVQQLQDDKATLQKSMERMEFKMLVALRNELMQKVQVVNGVNIITDIVEVNSADSLRKLCMDFKNELNNYIIILATNIGGKPSVAVMIDEAIATSKNIDAPGIIKNHISKIINGGGGGQKLFAQAGGTDASNLENVLKVAATLV